jgi:hypothetical protein
MYRLRDSSTSHVLPDELQIDVSAGRTLPDVMYEECDLLDSSSSCPVFLFLPFGSPASSPSSSSMEKDNFELAAFFLFFLFFSSLLSNAQWTQRQKSSRDRGLVGGEGCSL